MTCKYFPEPSCNSPSHVLHRYLRPGSLYHIVTVQDTIGVGGHFFSASHFTRTLETVIVEHFHVDDSADPEQLRVHIALFKVLRKYVDGIASNRKFMLCFHLSLTDLWDLFRAPPKCPTVCKSDPSLCRFEPAPSEDQSKVKDVCLDRITRVCPRSWLRAIVRGEDRESATAIGYLSEKADCSTDALPVAHLSRASQMVCW